MDKKFEVPNQKDRGNLIKCYDCKRLSNVLFPVLLYCVYPNDSGRNGYEEMLFCGACVSTMVRDAKDGETYVDCDCGECCECETRDEDYPF